MTGVQTCALPILTTTSSQAQYADVAEYYSADADYEPGTVVSVGGTSEITQSALDSDSLVIGVVSTNPAYVMNSSIVSNHAVAVALLGRVPCQVQGPVKRGDMLVSAGGGRARAETNPRVGTVIGKALEDFAGEQGTVEILVGKY